MTDTLSGEALDFVGRTHGLDRFYGETDVVYRERIMRVVTEMYRPNNKVEVDRPRRPHRRDIPIKLYPELATENNGYCRKCYRDGVNHKTAIVCPECRALLGGF